MVHGNVSNSVMFWKLQGKKQSQIFKIKKKICSSFYAVAAWPVGTGGEGTGETEECAGLAGEKAREDEAWPDSSQCFFPQALSSLLLATLVNT